MNDNQIDIFIKWLNTFDLKSSYSTVEALSDGVVLSEVLQQISPEWFTDSWKSKIKTNVGSNWRLRVSNLKKIVEAVMEYYSECLNQPLSGFVKPDAAKIGEQCDINELRKLLQLVLGCAINCNNKQHYITAIMKMEESVQQTLMQNIQELEGGLHGSRLSLGVSLNFESVDANQVSHQKMLTELQSVTELKDQLAQKCFDLDQQLSALQEEKLAFLAENKVLLKRVEEWQSTEESIPNLRYSDMRKQIDVLKEEIFKLETSRDDYRVKVEVLEKEIVDIQAKYDELQKVADESNNLKDEVDALRETADRVAKYELMIESYKKKMEDLSDLRRQVKILEDKNIDLTEMKIKYEDEVKKGLMARNNLEICKHQLAECHHKYEEVMSKNEKFETEFKKLEAKLKSVEREKERLIMERDALKESNDELKCSQLQPGGNAASDVPPIIHAISGELSPHKMKKELSHFDKQTKMLEIDVPDHRDKLNEGNDYSSDSVASLNLMRECSQKDSKEMEDGAKDALAFDEYSCDNSKLSNIDQIVQLNKDLEFSRIEQERMVSQMEEKEALLHSLKQKVSTLQETLNGKEYENAALEERYKKYVEKTKAIIKSLDPKQTNPSEILLLRSQCAEKTKIAEQTKLQLNQQKLLNEMEEKLMISAFYRLGFDNQREMADRRLINFSSSRGNFLSRQRQASRNIGSFYCSK